MKDGIAIAHDFLFVMHRGKESNLPSGKCITSMHILAIFNEKEKVHASCMRVGGSIAKLYMIYVPLPPL